MLNGSGDWTNAASDPMLRTYIYDPYGHNISITLSNLPSSTYDFYLYGHGPTTDNSRFQLTCGGDERPEQDTPVSGWNPSDWGEGYQVRGLPGSGSVGRASRHHGAGGRHRLRFDLRAAGRSVGGRRPLHHDPTAKPGRLRG